MANSQLDPLIRHLRDQQRKRWEKLDRERKEMLEQESEGEKRLRLVEQLVMLNRHTF